MLPIRDNIPRRTFPFVNLALIGLNAWAFIRELGKGAGLERYLYVWGLVPLRYATPGMLEKLGPKLYFGPFLTTMFLHGGWMHIISNMWMLYIFGDNVEDRLGHARYLLFYLLAGVAASLTQLWASWGSAVPTIGASGAIAGVLGAFFFLYPFARVVVLVPIFFFLETIEVPAFLFLGLWLWSQLSSGLALSGTGRLGGIAFWAHIGGFAAGAVLLIFLSGRGRGQRRFGWT